MVAYFPLNLQVKNYEGDGNKSTYREDGSGVKTIFTQSSMLKNYVDTIADPMYLTKKSYAFFLTL